MNVLKTNRIDLSNRVQYVHFINIMNWPLQKIPQHTTMLIVCHPKILHKHCFQFLLGVKMAPRDTENNAYAKFWGDKQRALWYVMVFLEWSIVIGQRPADFLSDHTEIIFFFSICIYEYTRISWFIISFWRFWELVSPLQDITIFLRIKF